MKSRKFFITVLLVMMLPFSAQAADPIIMEGNFVRTAISDDGTLGYGRNTSPGILYDSTGTGTFNTSYDYLTPGSPWEGFYFKSTETGVVGNNNAGGSDFATTGFEDRTSSGSAFDHHVRWTGNYDAGSGSYVTLTQDYWFNDNEEAIHIRTQVAADQLLTSASFLRTTDPDPDSNGLPGSTSATVNSRGYDSNSNGDFTDAGDISKNNFVSSVGPVSGAPLAMHTNSAVTHNTGISTWWSQDPADFLAETAGNTDDSTIGIAFDLGTLTPGYLADLYYSYVFGTSLSEAVEIIDGGARLADAVRENMKGLADEIQDDIGGDFVSELLILGQDAQHRNIMQLYSQAPPMHMVINNGRIASLNNIHARSARLRSPGLASTKAGQIGPEGPAGPDVAHYENGVSVWSKAFTTQFERFGSGDYSTYNAAYYDMNMGIDKSFGNSMAGLTLGYGIGHLDGSGGDAGDSQTWSLGFYGSTLYNDLLINGSASIGFSDIDLEYGSDFTKDADFNAQDVLLEASVGKNFEYGSFIFTPKILGQMAYYDQESYTEDSLVGTPREVKRFTHYDYILGAALTAGTEWQLNESTFSFSATTTYKHNFNADADTMKYTLLGGSGQEYSFDTQVAPRNLVGFGVAFGVTVPENVNFTVDANCFMAEHLAGWQAGLKISYMF